MPFLLKNFWVLMGMSALAVTTAHAMPASLKAAGMGGAATAYAQDSLTTVDNPANAADITRRFDLGFSWWGTSKDLTISDRPRVALQHGEFNPDQSNQFFGHAGMNYWIDPCIVVGIAFHNEIDIRTRYGVRLDDFAAVDAAGIPTGSNTRFEYTVNTITMAIAHRFWDSHSIGVSLDVAFARLGVAGLGKIAQPPLIIAPLSDSPDNVTDRGHAEATGVGITIGWMGYLFPTCLPGLSFGVAYSPRVSFGKLRKYEGLLADHRLAIPAKVRVGMAWDVLPTIAIALDLEFLNYSRTYSWSNHFPGDSTTGIGPLFGTRHGPGFGWRDQVVVKTGFDWQFCPHWTARAGYRYESSLMHDYGSEAAFNVLTFQTVQNYITAGLTWHIDSCFELTAFGEYGFRRSIHTHLPSITTNGGLGVVFERADLFLKAKSRRAGFIYGLRF